MALNAAGGEYLNQQDSWESHTMPGSAATG